MYRMWDLDIIPEQSASKFITSRASMDNSAASKRSFTSRNNRRSTFGGGGDGRRSLFGGKSNTVSDQDEDTCRLIACLDKVKIVPSSSPNSATSSGTPFKTVSFTPLKHPRFDNHTFLAAAKSNQIAVVQILDPKEGKDDDELSTSMSTITVSDAETVHSSIKRDKKDNSQIITQTTNILNINTILVSIHFYYLIT